jgi:hypothetical protein
MTGVCVNRSMEWERPVRVDELVQGIEYPDYPPMPTPSEPIDPRPLKQAHAHEDWGG